MSLRAFEIDNMMEANLKRRDQDDPKEVAIREKVAKMIGGAWIEIFKQVTDIQKRHMTFLVSRMGDEVAIRNDSQKAFWEISELYRAHFVDPADVEKLLELPKDKPILIAANHLGLYKLCSIDTADLGVSVAGYPRMYPFWGYGAGLYPIAQVLKRPLSYVSNQFPDIFHELHKAAGFVHVPTEGNGGSVAVIQGQILMQEEDGINPALVYFPEGTTSGKPNESDPYHLAPFKRGVYAISHDLELPRVLVAQFFHPEKGLLIKVLDIGVVPQSPDSKVICGEYAAQDQKLMQAWLDEMTGEFYPEMLRERRF